MTKSQLHTHRETKPEAQRAFLVGVEFRAEAHRIGHSRLSLESSMAELALLCQTAGLEVVGETTQTLEAPNPNTFIGSGKVEELVAWRDAAGFDVVVFDDELSPRHQRELEESLGEAVTVLDRTGFDPRHLCPARQHARRRAASGAGAVSVSLAAPDTAVDAPGAPGRRRHRPQRHGRRRLARAWRNPVGSGPPPRPRAHHAVEGATGGSARSARPAPRPAQAQRSPSGGHRRLHQRRQVDPAQHGRQGRGAGRGQAVRHTRPDHSPGAPAGRA